MKRSGSGRDADLVRLTHIFGKDQARVLAPLLGYRVQQRPPTQPVLPDDSAPMTSADTVQDPGEDVATNPLTGGSTWRLERYREIDPPRTQALLPGAGLTAADLALKPQPLRHLPRLPPLLPWSSVEPGLHDAIAHSLHGRRVDVPALVHRLSRGQPITRIPRCSRHTWPTRLTVLVDRSRRHMPFYRDQVWVLLHLLELLGESALRVEFLAAETLHDLALRVGELSAALSLEPGVPVLVLGDLGACSASPLQRALWAATGASLGRQQIPAVALCPVPSGVLS